MTNNVLKKEKRISAFTNISLRERDIKLVDKYKKLTKLNTRTETARYLLRLGSELYDNQQETLKKHLNLTN